VLQEFPRRGFDPTDPALAKQGSARSSERKRLSNHRGLSMELLITAILVFVVVSIIGSVVETEPPPAIQFRIMALCFLFL